MNMVLADTSVWVEHFRAGVPRLAQLLEAGQILMHPFILGELACGHLARREQTLQLLQRLQGAAVADDQEVLGFIQQRRLFGRGLGFVDAHLMASAAISGCWLWTRDQALAKAAAELKLSAALES
jgi:predicted nucleic acid-binding protein